jgi:hypothetical protein
MKTFSAQPCRAALGSVAAFPSLLISVCLAAYAGYPGAAVGQSMPSGFENGVIISAGSTVSGYYLGYGARKIAGPSSFVDIDTRHHVGIEGEARWLIYPQTASVHDTTWLVGARYSSPGFNRKFYPYVKGMVGFTQFNFPYSYAKGDYVVAAPGGGLDYRLTYRVRLRVDGEYQFWPQFTYAGMPAWGVSTGLRVRVF